MSDGYQFIWGYTVLNYFFAVTILAVVKHGIFNKFLESSPMRHLGKHSYGLYVFHQPILGFAQDIDRLGVKMSMVKPMAAIIAFPVTLLIANISYRFIEKPFLNLKDRFFPVDKT